MRHKASISQFYVVFCTGFWLAARHRPRWNTHAAHGRQESLKIRVHSLINLSQHVLFNPRENFLGKRASIDVQSVHTNLWLELPVSTSTCFHKPCFCTYCLCHPRTSGKVARGSHSRRVRAARCLLSQKAAAATIPRNATTHPSRTGFPWAEESPVWPRPLVLQ